MIFDRTMNSIVKQILKLAEITPTGELGDEVAAMISDVANQLSETNSEEEAREFIRVIKAGIFV